MLHVSIIEITLNDAKKQEKSAEGKQDETKFLSAFLVFYNAKAFSNVVHKNCKSDAVIFPSENNTSKINVLGKKIV